MIKSAKLRQIGVQTIDLLVKEGQAAHPMELMRRNARYSTGLRKLWGEYGINPEDMTAQQAAMAENDEYYNRMRNLYEETMMSPQELAQFQQQPSTLSEVAAASKKPVNISAENAPKVVSAPK